jgi:hypothetical protein
MILAIDGTNWIHQLWHASDGKDVRITFLVWLRAVAEHVRPSSTVVCFDRRSFRHDLSPAYKASRPEKPAGLLASLAAADRDHRRAGRLRGGRLSGHDRPAGPRAGPGGVGLARQGSPPVPGRPAGDHPAEVLHAGRQAHRP